MSRIADSTLYSRLIRAHRRRSMATWIGNDKRERARVTYRRARALGLVDTQQRLLDHVLCLVVAAENPVGACEHPPPKLVMLTGRDQLIEPPAAP